MGFIIPSGAAASHMMVLTTRTVIRITSWYHIWRQPPNSIDLIYGAYQIDRWIGRCLHLLMLILLNNHILPIDSFDHLSIRRLLLSDESIMGHNVVLSHDIL